MEKLTISQICTGCNKLTIPKFTSEHTGIGKKVYNETLVIVIDCSGSTNNSDRGCKGSRFSRSMLFSGEPKNQEENSDKNPEENANNEEETKIIIAAECEGIMYVLMEYCKLYNMCCPVYVIPFSSNYKVLNFTIHNNQELYDQVISGLGMLPYEGGGTNLLFPIKYIFEDLPGNDHLDIILATDGQPDNKAEVIAKLSEKQKRPFSIFVIGAGSISESAGNMRVLSRFGNYVRSSSIHCSSECDIDYLVSIANLSTSEIGSYCGAFGNYSELVDAAQKYIEKQQTELFVPKVCYKVKLDNNLTGELSSEVIMDLNLQKCVLTKTRYGYYLITQQWQLAINPEKTENIPDYFSCKKFSDSLNQINEKTQIIQLDNLSQLTLEIIFGDYKLYPAMTPMYELRIREIIKINPTI